jgi:hypothetical protein
MQRSDVAPCFLHQTDIFRPHNDPDDHWDLACAYALAATHRATLSGILIDHPPGAPILNHACDPDLGSVAQLSFITGINPPVAVGRPEFFASRGDHREQPPPSGVQFVLDQLAAHPEGLAIVIVGAARDLAEALQRLPDLFASNCRGIYLNIGSGCPDRTRIAVLEWNVTLDPAAYAAIFTAPCPIFWLPCLDDEPQVADLHCREWGSHYSFRQADILEALPLSLRNYFGWMFSKQTSSTWLAALGQDFSALLADKGEQQRMMYSTASFFHLAGLGVTREGRLLPLADEADWVYRFEPVTVTCSADGHTRWQAAKHSDRHLLHILDTQRYAQAMCLAMRQLLCEGFPAA